MGRRWLLWSAVALAGCGADGDFVCSRDEECVSGKIVGVCQDNDHCSFPDPACDSGQRYAQRAPAGFAQECVPGEVAGETTSAVESTTSAEGSTSTSVGSTGTGSGAVAESGEVTESGAAASTDVPELDTRCVEVDLGGALGMVDARNYSQEDDDFSPSCADEKGVDVVYLFVAPVAGEFRFEARGPLTAKISVALWESCSGSELGCGDNFIDPFRARLIRQLDQGEPVIVAVDSDEPDGQVQLSITLVP